MHQPYKSQLCYSGMIKAQGWAWASDRCWFVALVHSKLRPLLVADSLLLCDMGTLKLAQLMFEVNCFNCGLLTLCVQDAMWAANAADIQATLSQV